MAAFAREDRPATAHAGAIKCRAVIFLTVGIVVVTPPAWPLRQLAADHLVDHLDRVDNHRIMWISNPETDKMKKVATDDVARSVSPRAIGKLNLQRVDVRVRINGRRIARCDPNVVPRHPWNELASRRYHPVLDV